MSWRNVQGDATDFPDSAHCYTPSWCKCPDDPRCQLCKSGRCPVDPVTDSAHPDRPSDSVVSAAVCAHGPDCVRLACHLDDEPEAVPAGPRAPSPYDQRNIDKAAGNDDVAERLHQIHYSWARTAMSSRWQNCYQCCVYAARAAEVIAARGSV